MHCLGSNSTIVHKLSLIGQFAARFDRQSYVRSLKEAMPMAQMLALLGFMILILYFASDSVYKGDCDIDPMFQISIASTDQRDAWVISPLVACCLTPAVNCRCNGGGWPV